MPLDMPESVLVRFKGKMQPGITLRDLVHAIPLYAIKQGLLTVEKKVRKHLLWSHPRDRRSAGSESRAGVRVDRCLGGAFCRRLHHQAE